MRIGWLPIAFTVETTAALNLASRSKIRNRSGVTIVVDDHVHLGDASQFVVHFDAEQVLLCEVVPVLKMFDGSGLLLAVGITPHMVERVQKEPARAAGRIENKLLAFWVKNLDGEGNEFTRSEVLAEVAFKETAHKLFECQTLGVEFGAVEPGGWMGRE